MRSHHTKFAILFPGQGSQYLGMCADLYKTFESIKNIFKLTSELLRVDVKKLVFGDDMSTLTQSKLAQPITVAMSYALFLVLQEQHNNPPFCAVGHSLGELSALLASGAVEFPDAILFAKRRGELMHEAAMASKGEAGIVVDTNAPTLSHHIQSIAHHGDLSISGYNAPEQHVVAGSPTSLQALADRLSDNGGTYIPFRMIPMKVSAPFHTKQMAYLRKPLNECISTITFKPPRFAVWSTVTTKKINDSLGIKNILCQQLTTPVYWQQTWQHILDEKIDYAIDIGPQVIMRDLARSHPLQPTVYGFDDPIDRDALLKQTHG